MAQCLLFALQKSQTRSKYFYAIEKEFACHKVSLGDNGDYDTGPIPTSNLLHYSKLTRMSLNKCGFVWKMETDCFDSFFFGSLTEFANLLFCLTFFAESYATSNVAWNWNWFIAKLAKHVQ